MDAIAAAVKERRLAQIEEAVLRLPAPNNVASLLALVDVFVASDEAKARGLLAVAETSLPQSGCRRDRQSIFMAIQMQRMGQGEKAQSALREVLSGTGRPGYQCLDVEGYIDLAKAVGAALPPH